VLGLVWEHRECEVLRMHSAARRMFRRHKVTYKKA